jgi:hypothetical protein
MGILSNLFKKQEAPEPYDWLFLRGKCLEAIDSRVVPAEPSKAQLGGLDYDRLVASGDDAEDVVVEIWAVLTKAKVPELSATQSQEYLYHAAEMLRTATSPEAAAARLKEIEENVRKEQGLGR